MFSAERFDSSDLSFQDADAQHQVTDELTFVGITQVAAIVQFVDFTDVMQERPHQQNVGIDVVIVPRDGGRQSHETDDMVEQTALIGVMVLDRRGGPREFLHECFIAEETVRQIPQVGIRNLSQQRPQLTGQLVQRHARDLNEVVFKHVAHIDRLDLIRNNLDCAIKQLRRSLHPDVVSAVEAGGRLIGRIPHHRGDGSRLVGQSHLQVKIPVAVLSQLFLTQQKNLVDVVVFADLAQKASCHGK